MATNIKVKILNLIKDAPLIVGETYKVNFETKTHYIIFKNGIWYGIFKSDAKALKGE